jgi:hypothetical protein
MIRIADRTIELGQLLDVVDHGVGDRLDHFLGCALIEVHAVS